MTDREAKIKIAKWFIDTYVEWLSDYNNPEVTSAQMCKKYRYGKAADSNPKKDTQKTLIYFQSNICDGGYDFQWKNRGYDINQIYRLHDAGFLSYSYSDSHYARARGLQNYFFIRQDEAKKIYKAYKNGFFETC